MSEPGREEPPPPMTMTMTPSSTTTTTTTPPAATPPTATSPWRRLQRWWAQASAALTLRARLSLSLLMAVAVAVTGGTVAHLVEVSDRLERDLQDQAQRVTGAVRTDLEATATALDEELALAADPRAGVARLLGSGRVETRFLGAQARLVSGRLEILKVLARDGAILTSGHWPASFGALDPLITAYAAEAGRLPRIVDEATPQGSSPALERWTVLRISGRELVVVAGRFLDQPALERLRSRTGADLLALCGGPLSDPPTPPAVVAASSSSGASPATSASPATGAAPASSPGASPATSADGAYGASKRRKAAPEDGCLVARATRLGDGTFAPAGRGAKDLRLDVIDVGGLSLYVGLDRSGIERVRSGIIGRAVLVGILSVVFAVILGAMVARRIVRPIEELADAAARVARGDLSARVQDPQTGGEVQDLVDAFNLMARDLESGQKRLLQAERVAAWQEIARGLAHELKNPLTPILSAMDVIRRARQLGRADFDAILQEQAQAVVEEVMRLKELADAFARFARLPEKRPETLRPDELIDNALALYASGIPVTRTLPEVPVVVIADRTQLMTVFTNLIKNGAEAMEQMPEGERRLAVTLRVEDGIVTIDVDDAGPGISADVRDRLFTPYVTTKGSRGTGLGLALSHRIMAEHEGTIEAGLSPLGGARFTLRLPIAPTTTTTTTTTTTEA